MNEKNALKILTSCYLAIQQAVANAEKAF